MHSQVLFVTKGRFSEAEIDAFNLMMNVLLTSDILRCVPLV